MQLIIMVALFLIASTDLAYAQGAQPKGISYYMLYVVGWFFDYAIPLGAIIFQDLVEPIAKLGAAFFLLWIVWNGFKLLGVSDIDPEQVMKTFGKQTFAFIMFMALMSGSAYSTLVNWFYVPTVDMGLGVSAMILSKSDAVTGGNTLGGGALGPGYGGGGGGGGACTPNYQTTRATPSFLNNIPAADRAKFDTALQSVSQQRSAFMGQVGIMLNKLSFGMVIGINLIPTFEGMTDDASSTLGQITAFVGNLGHFLHGLLSGFALILAYGLLMVIFPIYIIMMLFRLFMMTMLAPFATLGIMFEQVRPMAGQLVRNTIAVAITFMGWAAVIALGMAMVMVALDGAMNNVIEYANENPDMISRAPELRNVAASYIAADPAGKQEAMSQFLTTLSHSNEIVKISVMGFMNGSFWLLILAAIMILVLMKSAQQMAMMLVNVSGGGNAAHGLSKAVVTGALVGTAGGGYALYKTAGAGVSGARGLKTGANRVRDAWNGKGGSGGGDGMFNVSPQDSSIRPSPQKAVGLGAMAQNFQQAGQGAGQAASGLKNTAKGAGTAAKGTAQAAKGGGQAAFGLGKGVAGLVAAPFTGGASLKLAAAGMQSAGQGAVDLAKGSFNTVKGSVQMAKGGYQTTAGSAKMVTNGVKGTTQPFQYLLADDRAVQNGKALGAGIPSGTKAAAIRDMMNKKPVAGTVAGMRFTAQLGKQTVKGAMSGAASGKNIARNMNYYGSSVMDAGNEQLTD
jgi:hypothetical protein